MRQGPPGGGRAAAAGVPLIVFQGDRDTTVAPANAAALLSPWSRSAQPEVVSGRGWTRRIYRDGDGRLAAEWWSVHRLGHAWSGGSPEGSFTDPAGPDASAELVRFFTERTGGAQERPRGLRAWLGGR
jgi:poly(3-hydroxybutyrate) depolymerase